MNLLLPLFKYIIYCTLHIYLLIVGDKRKINTYLILILHLLCGLTLRPHFDWWVIYDPWPIIPWVGGRVESRPVPQCCYCIMYRKKKYVQKENIGTYCSCSPWRNSRIQLFIFERNINILKLKLQFQEHLIAKWKEWKRFSQGWVLRRYQISPYHNKVATLQSLAFSTSYLFFFFFFLCFLCVILSQYF